MKFFLYIVGERSSALQASCNSFMSKKTNENVFNIIRLTQK